MDVLADIFLVGGYVTLSSFISVGETPNFVGQEVAVTTDAGWPLVVDLTQPDLAEGSAYNGRYGYVQGQATVQRSFVVQGGHAPAVALALGVVSAQAMGSEVRLDFPGLGDTYITPGSYARSGGGVGVVTFHYAPKPIGAQP